MRASSVRQRHSRAARAIIAEVATDHGLPADWLAGPSHRAELVQARQAAMLAIRQRTDLTLPEIGHLLNRDHTTVLYGIRQAAAEQGVPIPDAPPPRPRRPRPPRRPRTMRPAREALAEVDRLLSSGWTVSLLQTRGVLYKSTLHYWRTGKVTQVHRATLDRLQTVPALCEECARPALGDSRWCAMGGCEARRGRWSWSRPRAVAS